MSERFRYTVREEFFGALVYDRDEDSYLAFDDELLSILGLDIKTIKENHDVYQLLVDECFIADDKKNYSVFNNTHIGENLSSPARIHFYYTSITNIK